MPSQADRSSSPVVLCIDDYAPGLQIRRALLELKGYSVLIATTGSAGLELLTSNHVDVVVLDYKMPEMNGEGVAREVRRLYPELPILLLSGFAGDFPATVLPLVDGFILKGASPDELLSNLKAVGCSPSLQKAKQERQRLVENILEKKPNHPGKYQLDKPHRVA